MKLTDKETDKIIDNLALMNSKQLLSVYYHAFLHYESKASYMELFMAKKTIDEIFATRQARFTKQDLKEMIK